MVSEDWTRVTTGHLSSGKRPRHTASSRHAIVEREDRRQGSEMVAVRWPLYSEAVSPPPSRLMAGQDPSG